MANYLAGAHAAGEDRVWALEDVRGVKIAIVQGRCGPRARAYLERKQAVRTGRRVIWRGSNSG